MFCQGAYPSGRNSVGLKGRILEQAPNGDDLGMNTTVLFWRRTDVQGLERLELAVEPEGRATATSTVICLGGGGFRLDHHWRLDPDWRAESVTVERWNSQGHGVLRLERAAMGWRVDGAPRPVNHYGAADMDLVDEGIRDFFEKGQA